MTRRTLRSRPPRQPRPAEIDAALDDICRRDFGAFVQRFFPLLNGGKDLIPNWHVDALIYRLDQVRPPRKKHALARKSSTSLSEERDRLGVVAGFRARK